MIGGRGGRASIRARLSPSPRKHVIAGGMHRLFVALRPPETIRDHLIDTMEGLDGARWQSDDQLHLTLRFIGEVDAMQAEDLASALAHGYEVPAAVAIDELMVSFRSTARARRRLPLKPEGAGMEIRATLAHYNQSYGGVDRHDGLVVPLPRMLPEDVLR